MTAVTNEDQILVVGYIYVLSQNQDQFFVSEY